MSVLNETFIQFALTAGVLIAALSAYLGIFVILKRIVFVSIALAQIAAAGLALGFLLGINADLLSFFLTISVALFFGSPGARGKVSKESLIGYAYAFAAGLTVIFLAKNPALEAGGIDLVSGNLLFVNKSDLLILAVSVAVIGLLHFLFYKEFIFVSFDREMALTLGMKANLYDLLIYLSLGFSIALFIRIAGVVFVFAALVVPALTGLSIADRMKNILLVSIATAILSVFCGIYCSYTFDLPTGPSIVSVMGIIFSAAFLVKWSIL